MLTATLASWVGSAHASRPWRVAVLAWVRIAGFWGSSRIVGFLVLSESVFVALPINQNRRFPPRVCYAAGTACFVSSPAINSICVSLLSAPFSDHRPWVRPRVWLNTMALTVMFTFRRRRGGARRSCRGPSRLLSA